MYYDERHSYKLITVIAFHARSLVSLHFNVPNSSPIPHHYLLGSRWSFGKYPFCATFRLRVFLIISNQNAQFFEYIKVQVTYFLYDNTHPTQVTARFHFSSLLISPIQLSLPVSFNKWVRKFFVFMFSFFLHHFIRPMCSQTGWIFEACFGDFLGKWSRRWDRCSFIREPATWCVLLVLFEK